jgi:hypothetical protein
MTITTADGQVDYRKGDQVIVTRNHHNRDLLNGTRGTIRTLRRDGLVVQLTDGRGILLEKGWLAGGDLEHGYAMTLHKSQGRTVTTSLVLADESLSQEGGYVGLSRGTAGNHLYLDSATEDALRDCSLRQPAAPAAPAPPTRALTRSARHELATDLLHDPVRRDLVRHDPVRHAPRRDRSEGLSR